MSKGRAVYIERCKYGSGASTRKPAAAMRQGAGCLACYFKYELFSKIRSNGGYFVSRLKQSANPTIVSVLHANRGNAIDLAGKKLKDILPQLKQEVIDIEVEVSFKGKASKTKKDGSFEVYNPRGGTSKVKETYRLVGFLIRKPRSITSTSPTSPKNSLRQKM